MRLSENESKPEPDPRCNDEDALEHDHLLLRRWVDRQQGGDDDSYAEADVGQSPEPFARVHFVFGAADAGRSCAPPEIEPEKFCCVLGVSPCGTGGPRC